MSTEEKQYNYRIAGLEDLPKVAKAIVDEVLRDYKICIFNAPMGTGKTTLIKAICEAMGVVDVINSPTFSIVNEYTTLEGEDIYHFDCYRLNNLADAYNMGADNYLDSGAYCFIEWPEVMADLLPDGYAVVKMSLQEDNSRSVNIKCINY